MSDTSTLSVKPIIKYPSEVQLGKTYLMTVNLRLKEGVSWYYEDEEYPIYCTVESNFLNSKPVGEPILVLHRFGGCYGEVKFLLSLKDKDQEKGLNIILSNKYGNLIKVLNLDIKCSLNDFSSQNQKAEELIIPRTKTERVEVAKNWEEASSNLELLVFRKERQEIEKMINETLAEVKSIGSKHEIYNQITSFLEEREVQLRFSGGADSTEYKRELTVIQELMLELGFDPSEQEN